VCSASRANPALLEQQRPNVDLRIDDEGPGIPEFARPRVFEKFFSLERPETGKKSTGLGLNFAKEVALLHGGTVDMNNLPEQGLQARLLLPAA
jgi:two-component system, OmpR family, sensor histidine kinase CreC